MKALRQAACDGNISELKRLCKQSKNRVNEAGPTTRKSALHWGAGRGHNTVVSYLLKAAKVKVDALDKDLNTPLNDVIQALHLSLPKKLQIIQTLLAHGADPTISNVKGKSPLMNLMALRDQIPMSHYHQLKDVNQLIHKIKWGMVKKAKKREVLYFNLKS